MSWTVKAAACVKAVVVVCWLASAAAANVVHAREAEHAGSWQNAVSAAAQSVLTDKAVAANWVAPTFEVQVLDPDAHRTPMLAKRCDTPWLVEAADVRHVARMRFVVRCETDGRRDMHVVVRAKISAEVLAVIVSVRAGDTFGDDNVALQRHDITLLPDAVSDTQEVNGFAAKRSLSEGQVVTRKVLLTPLMVSRGAAVQIEAQTAGILVSAPAEALESGRLHEVVRVRNIASGKVIRARVVGAGVVVPEGMVRSTP